MNFTVETSPHIRRRANASMMLLDAIIALLPVIVFSCGCGWAGVRNLLIPLIVMEVAELLFVLIKGKGSLKAYSPVNALSAAVSALIFGLMAEPRSASMAGMEYFYLIAGSAFEGGSDNVEWHRDNMLPFRRDHDDPYVFTWTGRLGVFDGVVEPGRFKLEGQMTWGPRELHPYTQDEDLLQSTRMRTGGSDTKWHVSREGLYRIRIDLFHETFQAELLE